MRTNAIKLILTVLHDDYKTNIDKKCYENRA